MVGDKLFDRPNWKFIPLGLNTFCWSYVFFSKLFGNSLWWVQRFSCSQASYSIKGSNPMNTGIVQKQFFRLEQRRYSQVIFSRSTIICESNVFALLLNPRVFMADFGGHSPMAPLWISIGKASYRAPNPCEASNCLLSWSYTSWDQSHERPKAFRGAYF